MPRSDVPIREAIPSIEEMHPNELDFVDQIDNLLCRKTSGKIQLGRKDIVARINQYNVKIWIRPGILKAPFHKGLEISGFVASQAYHTDESLWEGCGKSILDLIENHGDHCDELRRTICEIERIAEDSGMVVHGYQPISFSIYRKMRIEVAVSVSLIDEDLREKRQIFRIGSQTQPYRNLKIEGRLQKERRERQGNKLITDSVMMNALSAMTRRNLEKSDKLLRKHDHENQDPEIIRIEDALKRLTAAGIKVPPAVESLNARNGFMWGRVRLAPGISYNRNVLLVKKVFPDALMQALIGKTIGNVLEHPWLPADAVIKSITVRDGTRTAISIEPKLVHFPSAIEIDIPNKGERS